MLCSCVGFGHADMQVPLHNVVLHSDLFQGEVAVGVRSALPIEDITFILGNGVAGGRVWADVPPPPVVSSVPLVRKQFSQGFYCVCSYAFHDACQP